MDGIFLSVLPSRSGNETADLLEIIFISFVVLTLTVRSCRDALVSVMCVLVFEKSREASA